MKTHLLHAFKALSPPHHFAELKLHLSFSGIHTLSFIFYSSFFVLLFTGKFPVPIYRTYYSHSGYVTVVRWGYKTAGISYLYWLFPL